MSRIWRSLKFPTARDRARRAQSLSSSPRGGVTTMYDFKQVTEVKLASGSHARSEEHHV